MFGKRWSPKSQHCYVTGGSQGLGLSVAQQLTKSGAHVSIVARGETNLAIALESLEKLRVSPDQQLKSYSYALDSAKASSDALEAASAPHGGRAPNALFLCAGSAAPKFFLEMTEDDLSRGMTNGYWLQAWTAYAGAKKMVKDGVKGRIVFVGSTLSYMSFIGWGSYSPAKHALRGLADTLRSEFLLYDITVQMFFPNTMKTAGYDNENETKPAITKKIEDGDLPTTPDAAAAALLKGVAKGQAHINGDLITDLFRASTRGSAPYHNVIVDSVLGLIAFIGIPIWRWDVDSQVRKHRAEHANYIKTVL